MSVEQVICQLAYKGKRRKPPHFWRIYIEDKVGWGIPAYAVAKPTYTPTYQPTKNRKKGPGYLQGNEEEGVPEDRVGVTLPNNHIFGETLC